MNQQNPYGGQQPQQWGQQPQAGGQQGWGQQAPQMHPGMGAPMGMPGPQPGQSGPAYGASEGELLASEASVEARSSFIEKTYLHLAGAIVVFVLLSAGFQMIPGIEEKVFSLLMVSEYSWLAVMGAFIAVSYVADSWAKGSRSVGMQYAGLGLYTVAEAAIFLPMIIIARQLIGDEAIFTAGGVTLAMFAAMTAYVFISKKDFSFMRGALSIFAMGAFGLIVASVIFGFNLGLLFSVGMVVLACGYILYYTSNVLHHYRVNQHVAAALALFSAVALLFWYVLRIFMSRR
ncbi:MAG: Bax inhibitor-1 family protein [Myxococcota bacterium]